MIVERWPSAPAGIPTIARTGELLMKPKLFALLLFIPLALVSLPSAAQDKSRAFADDTWSSGRIAAAVAQTGVHQNGVATTTPPSCTRSATPPSLPPSGGSVTLLANC